MSKIRNPIQKSGHASMARLRHGTNEPQEWIFLEDGKDDTNDVPAHWKDDFEGESWDMHFQSLREPLEERAVRQESFRICVTTKLDFSPECYQQMAGLTYYYDALSHYYLYLTESMASAIGSPAHLWESAVRICPETGRQQTLIFSNMKSLHEDFSKQRGCG